MEAENASLKAQIDAMLKDSNASNGQLLEKIKRLEEDKLILEKQLADAKAQVSTLEFTVKMLKIRSIFLL